MSSSWFPTAALDWLVPISPGRVLDISKTRLLAALLSQRDLSVFWAQPNLAIAPLTNVNSVIASADALPFDPGQFDIVTCHQSLHTFTPDLALGQIARTLRPTGILSASYLVRDDSVPWVRRLIGILRRLDPQAMSGDYGTSAIRFIYASRYFPEIEQKQFRVWRPIKMSGLIDMVLAQPLTRALDEDAISSLVDNVEALYRESARPADDLMLPFKLTCWRTQVSHDELTTPLARIEPGLRIQL